MSHLPLPREFYDRDAPDVARGLLGMRLIRATNQGNVAGVIVETEAYLAAGDSACHGARGKTPRNTVMFGPPGHAYVYAIHARWCLNVVTEAEGVASAVLIRAVEPLDGIHLMQQRRGTETPRDLARGPARLCRAFDVDKRLNGEDLTRHGELWIAGDRGPSAKDVVVTPRIGVTSAEDLPLRFAIAGSTFASGPRRLNGG